MISLKKLPSSLLGFFSIAVSILMFSAPALAYDEDTHFNMTFVLCRSIGFTYDEAFIIAAVDQGMDDSSDTVANTHGIIPHPRKEWLWHALDKGGEMHAAGIITRRDELFREALNESDPHMKLIRLGVFFHFQQDTWAHRHHGQDNHLSPNDYTTFTTPFGHGFWGHVPDGPPADPVAALMCLEDGVVYARRFLKEGLGRDPAPFLADYVPQGGSVDTGWKDKRKGKYFNQISLAGAEEGSPRRYLLELIRAQINAYPKCINFFPHYFLRRTAVTATVYCVKLALDAVCKKYEPYRAVADPEIVIPTTKQKEALGFSGLKTDDLLMHKLPDEPPYNSSKIPVADPGKPVECKDEARPK
jgi:hypothetical protein